MFREFDPSCMFHYLRSFRRVRVDFEAHVTAANAKLNLDGTPIGDDIIHCYFIQVKGAIHKLRNTLKGGSNFVKKCFLEGGTVVILT